MYTQFENWHQLSTELLSRIEMDDTFVIQLKVVGYEQSPYVQGAPESDGSTLIELSSGRFMQPSPTEEQHRVLLGLGWNRPVGDDHPNYFMKMSDAHATKPAIAQIFVDALQVGLGLDPSTIEA